jgi:TrmH family RNA methyltransferase
MRILPEVRLALGLLEKRKTREDEGAFVVEGEHLIEEAGDRVVFILTPRVLPPKLARGRRVVKVSQKEFTRLTSVETPTGIMAVVEKPEHTLADIKPGLIVFCVEIQDPGNLGTIIRGADAAGATGVILSRGTVDLYNQKVIRSTQGSLFHLPIVQVKDTAETVGQLKKQGIKVIATEGSGGKPHFKTDLSGPVVILIGNEGAGLPAGVKDLADEVVSIPMPGRAESLNAAMAATVILYEAVRQRWSKE